MLTGDAADPIRYEIDHVQEQDGEIGFAAGHLPYEDLQDMKKIRRYADSIDDCSNVEKRWVDIYRMQEQLRYSYQWPTFFKQGVKYKKPFIVNGHMFREPLDKIGQVDD
jgi:hypothetical protein